MEFSYSLSGKLRDELSKIENLRAKIYLVPLTVKEELRSRWEAQVARIYFAFSFDENPLTKAEITKILTSKKRNVIQRPADVLRYKEAQAFIYWNHLGFKKTVPIKAVLDLYDIIRSGRSGVEEKQVRNLMEYFLASPDHAVVQAGIVHEEILKLSPFSSRNTQMSFLLTLLFLYRQGYDFRGMLVLEEHFRKNYSEYISILNNANKTGNLTLWLEYFASAVIAQLEKVIRDIESLEYKTNLPSSYFDLNDRQKEILSLIEEPGSKITNRQAQAIFKISQITASRDLSHLKDLGLLISHGKGRSVYYTKG